MTYLDSLLQMTKAALRSTSDPSSNTESHTRKTVFFGKHVANRVKNHCMVNTFVNGGS